MNIISWIIIALIVGLWSFVWFHIGAVYGTKHTAHVWTDYIMQKCVRLDLLLTRIRTEFSNAAERAPEGMPVVMAEDTLLRIIDETVKVQNR